MRAYKQTCESVTEGHPDKICDQISDALLDDYLKNDTNARVAIECMISNNCLQIAGEVTSHHSAEIAEIAKKTILDAGYSDDESGFNVKDSIIFCNVHKQSVDIAKGVNREKICAGDQGTVYGYACDETSEYMPLPIVLAHRLTKRLAFVRKQGEIPYLKPDGKSQVCIQYDEKRQVMWIDNIVIAAQHHKGVDPLRLKSDIIKKVILPVIEPKYLAAKTAFFINMTGNFVIGGPMGDCGVTGRKLMVDTYGGIARHGGGAFSGKDPSKADRSAAYMARYVAKNLVAAGLCSRCELGLSYVIGVENPISVELNCFGTETKALESIYGVIENIFDFSIDSIIKKLNLLRPIYKKTAAYGHFGCMDMDYTWENTDSISLIQKAVKS